LANALNIERYRRVLGSLLPLGAAWAKVREHALFRAVATEFARVEERGAALLREIFPGAAVELLPDWETLLGLPDDATPEGITEDERRAQAAAKLAARGGLSAAYFQSIADKVAPGIATVKPAYPFRVGYRRVGDPLTNAKPPESIFVVGDRVGKQLTVPPWTFFFIVEYTGTLPEILRRTLLKRKPAHVGIAFVNV
jgi:uncharacterized protein YmfQ (DUF2313 family)